MTDARRPYVLLVEDAQGNVNAVGPFASRTTAERWEARNPHLADDVRGLLRLLPASSPEVARKGSRP